ncbi:5-oxoprolinase subunit PxpB [Chitinophaga sancti]|uniref:5-oxoprolinase subunit PxpB n=1 Tax=Chitinophaga sancti TaxID=1004 RepID=A0A1K1RBJ9_9BACT|nr:5-oxoprolinase subunit PxpB [Chitinophaga sancti]WQD65564.1 5-oxoprolinase subunit PxpB [Chitinophaga sancti]WQG88813.1 5-oxoprolinase subunit PxpB [Chitinophaga sancti]SFW69276.1 inhibitor of KinA [Chitinophaga sancti]
MNTDYTINPLGDHSLIIEWSQEISAAVHDKVMNVYNHLITMQLPYILDIIPAYASLTIVYDILLVRREQNSNAFTTIQSLIAPALTAPLVHREQHIRHLEIPVCYDPSLGLDLAAMAAQKGISEADIIDLHTSQTYTVYMLGFLPGFPYMGKVDDRLATPRQKKPRVNISAGSVGIAGGQTGIYPLSSPGGWNIIGRTPVKMFDASLDSPCYCHPGDEVKFIPISLREFHKMI